MKKFLMPLLALALTATAASAQSAQMAPGGQEGPGQRRTPDEMAARQTEGLTRQLALTPDQATKVQQILTARANEMQAMRGQMQNGGDRSQMREQMQANRAKYDDQFKAVLTPDQYTKFTAMEANRMGDRGGMGGRGGMNNANTDAKVKEKDGKVKIKAKSE